MKERTRNMEVMTLENILRDSKKALVLGIGGGGDVVGTLPTANLLETFGTECVVGGLSWERFAVDPRPGPRKLGETRGVRAINEVVWECGENAATVDGARFAEAGMARVLGKETLLVDVSYGPERVFEGIADAAGKLGADLVAGVDVGGDVLGFGNEKGLMSPLADAVMTAALYRLSRRMATVMGVFGFGSDGELTGEELERSFGAIAREGGLLGSWGISAAARALMERAVEAIPTEASRCPVEYAAGGPRRFSIRGGSRPVELDMRATVTFYVDPRVVYEKISRPARAVSECRSIEEASGALNAEGIRTELDIDAELYGDSEEGR